MNIRITAVICTFNRDAFIEKAVWSLVEQTLAKDCYQVIVVDNNSTDGTAAIVNNMLPRCRRSGTQIRYIHEPNPGLSFARNTGWQNAEGDIVAFMDDDAVAVPQWLAKIVDAFDNAPAEVGEVGGKVEPIWEIPPPPWLTIQMKRSLAIVDWSDSAGILEANQWLAGVNVAYKKELLARFNGFNTNLGRRGKNLLSMEEVFLKDRFREEGIKSYYDPQIKVSHFIPAQRLTAQWFYQRNYWQGISEGIYRVVRENLNETIRLEAASEYAKNNFDPPGFPANLILDADEIVYENIPSTIERKCFSLKKIGYLMGLLKGE